MIEAGKIKKSKAQKPREICTGAKEKNKCIERRLRWSGWILRNKSIVMLQAPCAFYGAESPASFCGI